MAMALVALSAKFQSDVGTEAAVLCKKTPPIKTPQLYAAFLFKRWPERLAGDLFTALAEIVQQ
jgi:hypothetical protein